MIRQNEMGEPRNARGSLIWYLVSLLPVFGPATAIALLCLTSSEGSAEPYLAIREGKSCAACHVNRTGAGMRNDYGNIYSQTLLPMKALGKTPPNPIFIPRLNDSVSLGGALRVSNQSGFPDEGDDTNGFEINEGNLYVEARILPDFLTFYLDQSFGAGGTSSREAFVMVSGAQTKLSFKAGRMILPYGLAVWDDDAFIRRRTGFNFSVQDIGVQLGWQPPNWDLNATVSNGTQGGTENNKEKQVTASASWIHPRGRFGGSYTVNRGVGAKRQIAGVSAGVHYGRFDLLGEFDVIQDEDDDGKLQKHGDQRVAYGEANLLLTQGLSLKFAYDYWDPFTDVGEDQRSMVRFGVEPFIAPFLQVRLFYRHREAPPQIERENRDDVFLEVHAFF